MEEFGAGKAVNCGVDCVRDSCSGGRVSGLSEVLSRGQTGSTDQTVRLRASEEAVQSQRRDPP